MRGNRLFVVAPGIALPALVSWPGPGGPTAGEHLWTRQSGTASDEATRGNAVGAAGQAIVAGKTGVAAKGRAPAATTCCCAPTVPDGHRAVRSSAAMAPGQAPVGGLDRYPPGVLASP